MITALDGQYTKEIAEAKTDGMKDYEFSEEDG